MPEITQSTEFVCPKCSGGTFGGSRLPDDTLEYMCHSGAGRTCGFRWHQSESWRYFQLVTRRSFDSDEEFVRISDELNNDRAAIEAKRAK